MTDTPKTVQCWDGDGKLPPEIVVLYEKINELSQFIFDQKAKFEKESERIVLENQDLRKRVNESESDNIKLRRMLNDIETRVESEVAAIGVIADRRLQKLLAISRLLYTRDGVDDDDDLRSIDLSEEWENQR